MAWRRYWRRNPTWKSLERLATVVKRSQEVLRLAPRVAIIDISMPELDGIEAARQILAGNPEVHVMILSMHAGAQHVFHALEAGVRGYLSEGIGEPGSDRSGTDRTVRPALPQPAGWPKSSPRE